MDFLLIVAMALLFAILTPGILLYLPPGSSRTVAALFHGFVFAFVWHFVHRPLSQFTASM